MGGTPPDLFTAARCDEGDVPAVPGNGDPVDVKRVEERGQAVEEREQVALVVHVPYESRCSLMP
jgi:hypothetical protein